MSKRMGVNNVPDRNGINRSPSTLLSPLQERILAALPLAPDKCIPTAEIFRRIGVTNPSNVERAALSRSLVRLERRGLVTGWYPQITRQGRGFLWSRTNA